MGYLGKEPSAVPLTSDDITDNTITSAKIVNGAITGDDINSTFNVSSKTVTLPSASVTAHATDFDDNKIVNDISTLAIRQASNENKGAYNTNSMFVDVFQDDTGIASNTNAPRNASEYVSTTVPADGVDSNTVMMLHFNTAPADAIVDSSDNSSAISFTKMGSASTDATQKKFGSYSYHNEQATSDYLKSNALNTGLTRAFPTTGDFTVDFWAYQSTFETSNRAFSIGNGTNTTSGAQPMLTWSNNAGSPSTVNLHSGGGSFNPPITGSVNTTTGTWQHYVAQRTGTKMHVYIDGKIYWHTTDQTVMSGDNMMSNGYDVWLGSRSNYGSTEHWRGYIDEFRISNVARYDSSGANGTQVFTPRTTVYSSAVSNATGNFISNNITAPSSTNKMGAIITYQDNAGTNTLNTDIVLKLSADGGSNYSTATLTAMPDFSSGIKMAKVNDLSVTAGTQLKYKLEFANQSSGSKEARIRGVSLQY